MRDVGRPKAEVAAERIMERVRGVTVTPHFGRIEDKARRMTGVLSCIVYKTPACLAGCILRTPQVRDSMSRSWQPTAV